MEENIHAFFYCQKLKIRRRENRHNIKDRLATVPQKMRSETAKHSKIMQGEQKLIKRAKYFLRKAIRVEGTNKNY